MAAASVLPALVGVVAVGCAQGPERATRAEIEAAAEARAASALEARLDRIAARADSIDEIFRPLPLIAPSTESALRRHPNRDHVARARALGISRGADATELEALVRDGRLVPLEESARHWIVRELNRSAPLVVPEVRDFLVRLGERFHARLADLGAPPFRFEITSVLRTAADQAALRRTNSNAARGASAHEFGTTLDIAYDGFAAPARPPASGDSPPPAGSAAAQDDAGSSPASASASATPGAEPWLDAHLERVETAMLERVAARRTREIQAIFAEILREMQASGEVLVTLERRQPVYHITVAR